MTYRVGDINAIETTKLVGFDSGCTVKGICRGCLLLLLLPVLLTADISLASNKSIVSNNCASLRPS